MARPKVEAVGGIRVTASNHGRTTPANPTRTLIVPVEMREVESVLECGFQVEWGSIDEIENGPLVLCTGAGFGSAWATIQYAGKYYAIAGTDIVSAFLEALSEESSE